MSYPNYKINFRKIIEEANRKDRERWIKINEYCEKRRKNQVELVREAVERIRRNNQKKYDKINDPKTPDWERAALIIEDILTTL
jgi:uncharacterized protein YfaT (DUF1175 family)